MGFLLTIVYVAASYLRPFELFPELAEYRIMAVLGVACGLFILADVAAGSTAWLKAPQTYLMLAFVFWIGASVALNGWIGGALLAWGEFSITALVFLFSAVTITSARRLSIFASVIVACTLVLALQSIAAYHFGYKEDIFVLRQSAADSDTQQSDAFEQTDDGHTFRRIRSLGFLNDPNDFAQAMVLVFPLLAVWWRPGRSLRNFILVVLPTAVLLYAIYLTFSRGAAIALAVLLFMVIQERWGMLISGSAGAGLLLAVSASNFIAGRAISVEEESAASRIDSWGTGISLLRQHPLAGVGYNRFLEYNPLTAHNSFVLCFAELGLVGYFVWLALLTMSLLHLGRLFRKQVETNEPLANWTRALRNSLVAFLAASLFLSRTYSQSLYVLLGMSVALYSIDRNTRALDLVSNWAWAWRTLVLEIASIIVIYGFVVGSHVFGK